MKCQFGCAGYGKTLCCPPHTPTPEEMRRILDSYSHALLLHLHWTKDYKTVNNFNETLVDLERVIFLDGYYKAWALGSGPCDRCEKCNVPGAASMQTRLVHPWNRAASMYSKQQESMAFPLMSFVITTRNGTFMALCLLSKVQLMVFRRKTTE